MNRITVKSAASFLLVGLIIFFLIRVLYRNWLQVKSFDFSFDWSSLVLSFLILLVYLVLRVYIWKVMLHKMKVSLAFRTCLKISFLSTMGKYLPGKVWLVLGKVYLAGKEGIPKPVALASAVLEVMLELTASIAFFLVFLSVRPGLTALSSNLIFVLIGAVVGGLIMLHPALFYAITNMVLRWMKKDSIQAAIGYTGMIHLFSGYVLLVLVQGIAFYFFINAICFLPLNTLFGLSASVAAAGALGTLSFFAPSGLGVREGVLAVLLTTYVVSPVAVLISLLARIWVTLGELVCALFGSRL
jgi:glycosyltransferase 2 family protein